MYIFESSGILEVRNQILKGGGVPAADTGVTVVARAVWLGARPAGGGLYPGFLCLFTTLVFVPPALPLYHLRK